MRLELAAYSVDDVTLGADTRLDARRLTVSANAVRTAIAHPAIESVDVQLVQPGERVRITQISDVIEPPIKVSGGSDVFPGLRLRDEASTDCRHSTASCT
jgi:glycine reductase